MSYGIFPNLPRIERTPPASNTVARSSDTTLKRGDKGLTVIASGTFSQTFENCSALGAGWWCEIVNVGTGILTIDPSGTEKVYFPGGANAGDATMTLPYSGSTEGPYNVSGVKLVCDGVGLYVTETRETHGEQLFTGSGTWTAGAGVTSIWLDGAAPGGGGGGAANGASTTAGGGGGGQAIKGVRYAVVPGTAYTVTIGAVGTGGTAGANAGTAGGTTSFGALVSLAGGSGALGAAAGANSLGAAAGGTGGMAGGCGRTVGGSATTIGGDGGGTIWGAGATQTAAAFTGATGGTYGGGGSGAGSTGGGTAAGGNGGPGFFHARW